MAERSCERCGEPFAGRPNRKYCSTRCTRRAYNERRIADGRLAGQRERHREKRAEWQNANRHKYKGRYDEAIREYERSPERRAAVRGRDKRRTARRRLAAAGRPKSGRYTWTAGMCAVCGESFVFWSQIRTCGPQCSKALKRRRVQERKRAKYAALRSTVCERDDWICGICGDPVNRDAVVPELDAPTVDHILPRDRGGTDALDNLQCAHFYCNSVKGNRVGFTVAA